MTEGERDLGYWPADSYWVVLLRDDGLMANSVPAGTLGWCYGGRGDDLLFVQVEGRGICLYPGKDRWVPLSDFLREVACFL